MILNSIVRFVPVTRIAGLLAFMSAMSFLPQIHAADPTFTVVPASGATGVSPTASVVFTFSESMDASATFASLFDTNGSTLSYSSTWSDNNEALTLTPITAFPTPDEVIWAVSGQDPSGDSLQGIPDGFYFIGSGGGETGPCDSGPNSNTLFTVSEEWLYDQNGPGAPTLDPNAPYTVSAELSLISNLSASAVSLSLPTSAVSNLTELTSQLFITAYATNELTAFQTAWPNGDYVFSVTGAAPISQATVAWTLTQPNAPQVVNYAAAQAVDPTKAFTLTWDAFTDPVSQSQIELDIDYNSCAGTGFFTNLPSTATSTTIPAGILESNTSYTNAVLFFVNALAITNTSPKYQTTGTRSTATFFTLTTIGGAASSPIHLTNAVWSGVDFTFNLSSSPGKPITVQYSTTLKSNNWANLMTITNVSGLVSITDTPPKTLRFYRAHY
jgi:hypothetical protein